MEAYKIKNYLQLLKLYKSIKSSEYDCNWLINFKEDFEFKKALGFDCMYANGYFIWSKSYKPFNL